MTGLFPFERLSETVSMLEGFFTALRVLLVSSR